MRLHLVRLLITGLFTGAGVRVIQFSMHVLLARQLGIESYGLFTYTLGLALFLAHLIPLGWNIAITRFVAQYKETQQWDIYRGAVRSCYEVCFIAIAFTILLLLFLVWIIPMSFEIRTSLLYAAALLPSLTLSHMLRRQLVGLGAAKTALFLDDAVAPLIVIGIFVVLGGDLADVLMTYVVAAIVVVGLAFTMVRRTTPAEVSRSDTCFRRREWWRIALPSMLGMASRRAMNRIDILMIGPFLGPTAVGIYSVAFRLNNLLAFLPNIIGMLLSSRLARTYYRADLARTRQLFLIGLGASVTLSLPVVAVILIFPELLLRWTFGENFVVAGLLLQIIAIGQFANAASGPTAAALTLTGRHNASAPLSLIALVINVVGNLVALLTVGLVGVAVVTAATLILQNVWAFGDVASHLRLWSHRLRPTG
jgi:O-antigen/teichoic acid export membrane protein